MEDWRTKIVELSGGVLENISPLVQGIQAEGSLISGINYEPSLNSGYSRIKGFSKYSEIPVSGDGPILGAFPFKDAVIACREDHIEISTGTSWTSLATGRSGAKKYLAERYSFGVPNIEKIILVDGENWPVMYNGSTLVELNSTTYTDLPATLEGATSVTTFKRHVFYTKGQQVLFSAPSDETSHAPTDGGGAIDIGQEVFALKEWRDILFIFGPNCIFRITGSNSSDFASAPVTTDIGCVSPFSIREINGDLTFLAPDGLRTVAGTDRINDTALETLTRDIDKRLNQLDYTNPSTSISSVIIREKNQYRLFASKQDQSVSTSRGILGGLRKSALSGALTWEWFDILGIKPNCADSIYNEDGEVVVFGGWDGYVYKFESGDSFDGSPVTSFLRVPYWTYDDPQIRKVLRKARIYFLAEGRTNITFGNTLDYQNTNVIQPEVYDASTGLESFYTYGSLNAVYGTAVYGSIGSIISDFNLEGSCFNNSFFFSAQDTNPVHTIQTIVVEYTLAGRR